MTFDFVNDRVFTDRTSAFAPQTPQMLRNAETGEMLNLNTGAKVNEDGSVEFGVYAPNAQNVQLIFGIRGNQPIDMQKDNLGFIQMPAGPKRHVTLIGGSYHVFNNNATDEQIDAAFKYLDWNGQGRVLDDAVRQKMIDNIDYKIGNGELIGVLNASPYTDDDPKRAFEIQLNTVDKANVNMNHVKLYNDQSNIEWQEEEPIEAQALYALLDNAIQAVLTDENADCAKLIEEAYKDFQTTLDIVNNG